MLFLFFICDQIRECQDMRFCKENIYSASNNFILNSINFSNNELTGNLIQNGEDTKNRMKIYKVSESGFRIKINFAENLASYRYDISMDPSIMMTDNIEKHDPLDCISNENNHILKYQEHELHVSSNPLLIKYTYSNELYLTINSNNLLTIEDGSPAPDEFFDGFNETFPHGKSAVGIDISFDNPKVLLTGLSEGIEDFNFDDGIIRRYNYGTYSHYGYVPFLIGHCSEKVRSASIYWSNPTDTFWKFSTSTNSRDVRVISESGFVDLFVFIGNAKELTPALSTLTGLAPLPPIFTLGYHQSKWGYKSQSMVQNVTDLLEKFNIPHDVLWVDIDQWEDNAPFIINKDAYPNITKLAQNLSERRRFLVRIADPHLAMEKSLDLYDQAKENNYFVKDLNGEDYVADCWPGKSSWPDFTRSEVRDWWSEIYGKKEGWVDNVYVWNDMNEADVFDVLEGTFPKDALFHDGLEVRQLHSLYGHLMACSTFNGLMKRNLRPFVLTRSFFAGTQRFAWHWSGDNTANYTHLGLSLDLVMKAGLCGLPYSGSDIGGYFNEVSDVLLARWYQASMLTQPFFREHNRKNNSFREPYLYIDKNPTVYKSIVKTIKDRYRSLALWYTAAYHNSLTGIPISLPLWIEFNEKQFESNHDHVLVDGKLLSVPVLNEDMFDVMVIKPPGRWFHWKSGHELIKSGWYQAPIDEPAAFLRGGSITPFFDEHGMTTYETIRSNITLYIALDEKGESEGDIYIDDGRSFKFKEGEFVHTNFIYNKSGFYVLHKGEYQSPSVQKIIIFGMKKNESPSFHIAGEVIEVDDEVTKISNIAIEINQDCHISIEKEKKKNNLILIISISIAAVVVTCVIIVAVIILYRRKKGKINKEPLLSTQNQN